MLSMPSAVYIFTTAEEPSFNFQRLVEVRANSDKALLTNEAGITLRYSELIPNQKLYT